MEMENCFNEMQNCCCECNPFDQVCDNPFVVGGEVDILSGDTLPVVPCTPCWDNCKCTKEIKKLQKETKKNTDMSGRIVKLEKDIVNYNSNLTQQIGDLAEKEEVDIETLNRKIDNETQRATDREDELEDMINNLGNELGGDIDNLDNKIDGVDDKVDQLADDMNNDLIADAVYNKSDRTIYFKNKNGVTISTVDADDFVIDGMIDNVVWENRKLIITWNTAAGKQPTTIDGDQIFDPDDYYTARQTDNTFLKSADAASTYETRARAVIGVALDGDHLVLTFGDGHTTTCALPAGLANINTITNIVNEHSDLIAALTARIQALEGLWSDNGTNLVAKANRGISVSNASTFGGSVTGAEFYDSTIS